MSLLASEAKCIERVRVAWGGLCREGRQTYTDLILMHAPASVTDRSLAERDRLAVLADSGPVTLSGGGECYARFRAPVLRRTPFATDVPPRCQIDAVFPLYPERLRLTYAMTPPADGLALDLCAGSALYSPLPDTVQRVVAVGINPRTLALAAFSV